MELVGGVGVPRATWGGVRRGAPAPPLSETNKNQSQMNKTVYKHYYTTNQSETNKTVYLNKTLPYNKQTQQSQYPTPKP